MNTRKKRIQLWEEDPHCYWCGKQTVDPYRYHKENEDYVEWKGKAPNNLATLDHVYSKLDENRQSLKIKGESTPVVLACFECNQRRNIEFLVELKKQMIVEQRTIVTGSILENVDVKFEWKWENNKKKQKVRAREKADRLWRENRVKSIRAERAAKKKKRDERKKREQETIAKIFRKGEL